MKASHSDTIKIAAGVLAESFLSDPGTAATLEGLSPEKKDKVLKTHALLHLRYASRRGLLHFLDGNAKAFLIGGPSDLENKLAESLFKLNIVLSTLPAVGFSAFYQLAKKSRNLQPVTDLNWYRDSITGRHYRLKIIAVDSSLRGSGAFRRLVTPALQLADRNALPIVLETHNPANVGLYEHFGFKLEKTLSHPTLSLQQYCMIRKPMPANLASDLQMERLISN
ncbi:MAG: GNAT family N-acetyltransferase [Balneolaceae bacterium]|nr:MAG: GNAT family N-acetyltransferase [Balneolaceae bacterium]